MVKLRKIRKKSCKRRVPIKNPDALHAKIISEIESEFIKLPEKLQKLQYITISQGVIIKKLLKQINDLLDFAYKNRK